MFRVLFYIIAFVVALVAAYWVVTGSAPISIRNGQVWVPIHERHPLISRSVALALNDPPEVRAGAFDWAIVGEGLEVAEVPVLAEHKQVDQLFLVRINPDNHQFRVHVDEAAGKGPSWWGARNLGEWMRDTGALVIVNGSYFDPSGFPSTPVVVDRQPAGPNRYDANHGAFVANGAQVAVVDLAERDWEDALTGADSAMVSYPLLMDRNRQSRVSKPSTWLANRSFVGEDSAGHIIIGTTADGFFSLDRLADFLIESDIDLKTVLNLDGGPVACQGIQVGDIERRVYGKWEVQTDENGAYMLPPLWAITPSPMPIVLAVYPRTGEVVAGE